MASMFPKPHSTRPQAHNRTPLPVPGPAKSSMPITRRRGTHSARQRRPPNLAAPRHSRAKATATGLALLSLVTGIGMSDKRLSLSVTTPLVPVGVIVHFEKDSSPSIVSHPHSS